MLIFMIWVPIIMTHVVQSAKAIAGTRTIALYPGDPDLHISRGMII